MNWWNLSKLRKQLQLGTVGVASQFGYLVAFVILELFTWAVDTVPWRAPELRGSEGGIVLILKIVGPLLCFFANGGADGRDFILRYVALSFPARIRAMVLLILGLFPLAAFTGFTRGIFGLPDSWSWKILAIPYFFVGLNAIHLGIVAHSLRRLRQSEQRVALQLTKLGGA